MEPVLQIVEADLNGDDSLMVELINEHGKRKSFTELRSILEDEHVVDIALKYFELSE